MIKPNDLNAINRDSIPKIDENELMIKASVAQRLSHDSPTKETRVRASVEAFGV